VDAAAPSVTAKAPSVTASAPSLSAAAPLAPAAAAPAAFAPVAAPLAVLAPSRAPADAAPATVLDSMPVRRLSVHITPSTLWLPAAALAAYLIVTNLPEPPAPREAPPASAQTAMGLDAPRVEPPSDPHAGEEEPDDPEEPSLDPEDPDSPALPPPAGTPVGAREQAQKLKIATARSEVKVIMYYTDWCQRCLEARGYLAGRGIRVEARDIEKDAKAKARHHKLNPKDSVPTLVIEGKVLVGFNPERIDRTIDKAARARVARKR
jgi:glutaredoxin